MLVHWGLILGWVYTSVIPRAPLKINLKKCEWARPASPPLPEIESKYHHHNLCLVFFKMTHKLSAGKGFQSPNVVFFKKSEVTERNTKAVKRIKTVFITILVTIGSFLCIFGFLLVSTGLCRLWKFCRNFWTIYIYIWLYAYAPIFNDASAQKRDVFEIISSQFELSF
jgi:hypothetical protein